MSKEITNPVSLSELDKALDSLILQEAPPLLAADDVTIQRLAERAKCGYQKAGRMLEKWTADGRVTFVGQRRDDSGHKVKAWKVIA
jgi:hypothetical protein